MNTKPKFLYVVRDADSECSGAFVAESVSDAKKMALREDIAEEWTQLRVSKKKNDVSDWRPGIVDYKKCLREGIFSYVEDDCDNCKSCLPLSNVLEDGRCVCGDCYDIHQSVTK